MDEVLEKISAYMVYLAAQKSRIAEQLEVVKTVFDQRLNTATERLTNSRKFRTYGERKALCLRTSSKLQEMEQKVVKLSAKLKRLEELPRVVNDRLFTLRRIYERRVYEQRNS